MTDQECNRPEDQSLADHDITESEREPRTIRILDNDDSPGGIKDTISGIHGLVDELYGPLMDHMDERTARVVFALKQLVNRLYDSTWNVPVTAEERERAIAELKADGHPVPEEHQSRTPPETFPERAKRKLGNLQDITDQIVHLARLGAQDNEAPQVTCEAIERIAGEAWELMHGSFWDELNDALERIAGERPVSSLYLTGYTNKVAVIKVVKDFFDLGLNEAKELVESAPVCLMARTDEGYSSDRMESLRAQLEAHGGTVEVRS